MKFRHACSFETAREARKSLGHVQASLLDVHAEATSEKAALAWHMDGFVSAVIGTHTHVQTADERILPQCTALLSDAGMCGPYASVIGLDPEVALERFLTGRSTPHAVATGDVWVCGAVIVTDDATGKATEIKRVKRQIS
jgi:calcineurin-like phosphoesterase